MARGWSGNLERGREFLRDAGKSAYHHDGEYLQDRFIYLYLYFRHTLNLIWCALQKSLHTSMKNQDRWLPLRVCHTYFIFCSSAFRSRFANVSLFPDCMISTKECRLNFIFSLVAVFTYQKTFCSHLVILLPARFIHLAFKSFVFYLKT